MEPPEQKAIGILESTKDGEFWHESADESESLFKLSTFGGELTAMVDHDGTVMLMNGQNVFVIRDITSFANAMIDLESDVQTLTYGGDDAEMYDTLADDDEDMDEDIGEGP